MRKSMPKRTHGRMLKKCIKMHCLQFGCFQTCLISFYVPYSSFVIYVSGRDQHLIDRISFVKLKQICTALFVINSQNERGFFFFRDKEALVSYANSVISLLTKVIFELCVVTH